MNLMISETVGPCLPNHTIIVRQKKTCHVRIFHESVCKSKHHVFKKKHEEQSRFNSFFDWEERPNKKNIVSSNRSRFIEQEQEQHGAGPVALRNLAREPKEAKSSA